LFAQRQTKTYLSQHQWCSTLVNNNAMVNNVSYGRQHVDACLALPLLLAGAERKFPMQQQASGGTDEHGNAN